ncbi:unnamed protein product [Protopolystoma xenopodis]|uniref:Uncharacterized protein n=1 Tax=Protopolystoma xenopodis TaxID=117903 RepID=A0A3S5A8Q2_9PLAT|nr:unnamed protein product [Protopolystoma xenopodis]
MGFFRIRRSIPPRQTILPCPYGHMGLVLGQSARVHGLNLASRAGVAMLLTEAGNEPESSLRKSRNT